MSHFLLNGASVDVRLGAGAKETVIVGDKRRMHDGSIFRTARAEKDAYSVVSQLMARDDADALSRFLLGHGHNMKFASAADYYSSKGLAKTATNGTPTAGGAAGKFDKRLSLDDTEYVTWTPTGRDALTGDYTIAVWWLDTTWKHVLKRYVSATTTTTYYRDGVADAAFADWTGNLSVTAGVLKLLGEAGGDAFSDLVALPFAVPTGWIAGLAASTRAFCDRPFVEASGDLFNSPSTPLTCDGSSDVSFAPESFVDSALQVDGGRVSFRLEET